MQNLLFSPNGRIGSDAFIKAGFILILIGTGFSMTQMLSQSLGVIFGTLSIFLIYPWICIWVKRLRMGGKSGWMVLLYIVIYGIILMIGTMTVMFTFGGGEFLDIIAQQMSGELTQTEYMQRIEAMSIPLRLPITISSLLSSLLALYIGDKTIPHVDAQFDTFD